MSVNTDQDLVTMTLSRNVPRAQVAGYEAWLAGISQAAAQMTDDYLGATIIRPADVGGVYHSIIRFASVEGFERWNQSQQKQDWIARLNPAITPVSETMGSGYEYWFTARQITPPRWKSMLITYIAIFALLLSVEPILSVALAPYVPLLLSKALVTAVITVLMSLVALPLLNRLLKSWLFKTRISKL